LFIDVRFLSLKILPVTNTVPESGSDGGLHSAYLLNISYVSGNISRDVGEKHLILRVQHQNGEYG
jgi:hypothetical protein